VAVSDIVNTDLIAFSQLVRKYRRAWEDRRAIGESICELQMNSRGLLTASLDLAAQIFTPLLRAAIVDEERMIAVSDSLRSSPDPCLESTDKCLAS
jgi:hypothetical protein